MKYKVSFALVDDNLMAELNKSYKGREGTTDVLSFGLYDSAFEKVDCKEAQLADSEKEERVFLLGEVIVSKEQAKKQAEELGHSFEEEVGELFKHGVLHLLGKHHGNKQ
ncbi:MAG: rRNA maturation RNase YbeY [Patescibacteria group bacterium]